MNSISQPWILEEVFSTKMVFKKDKSAMLSFVQKEKNQYKIKVFCQICKSASSKVISDEKDAFSSELITTLGRKVFIVI